MKVLSLLFGLAATPVFAGPSLIVTRDYGAALINNGDPGPSLDVLNGENVREVAPGFLHNRPDETAKVRTTALAGRLLHETSGHSLVMISEVNGWTPPAFNGVVLDREGQIVANYVLHQPLRMRGIVQRIKKASVVDGWTDYVFKNARFIGKFSRDDESVLSVPLRSGAQIRSFENLVRSTRVMIRLFGVGTSRPTWFFVDLSRKENLDVDLTLLRESPSVNRLFILTSSELRCAADLDVPTA